MVRHTSQNCSFTSMVSWTFYVVKLTFQKVSLKFYVVNLTFFYGQIVTFCLVNLLLFICSQLDELFIWRLMQYIAHEARNNSTQGNLQFWDIRFEASLTATGGVSSGCNPSTNGSSAIAAELGRRFLTFNAKTNSWKPGAHHPAENAVQVRRTTRHPLDRSH